MSALSTALGGGSLAFYGWSKTGKTVAMRGLAREALAAGEQVIVIEISGKESNWASEESLGAIIATTHTHAVGALHAYDYRQPMLVIADDLALTMMPERSGPIVPETDWDYDVESRERERFEIELLLKEFSVRRGFRIATAMLRPDVVVPAARIMKALDCSPVLMLKPGMTLERHEMAMVFGPKYLAEASQAFDVLTVTDRGVGLAVVGGRVKPVRFPFVPWQEPVT